MHTNIKHPTYNNKQKIIMIAKPNNLLRVVVNDKYFDHHFGFYLFCQQWTPHILYF